MELIGQFQGSTAVERGIVRVNVIWLCVCVRVVIGGWRSEGVRFLPWRNGDEIEQTRDREQKTKKHKMKTKHWRTEDTHGKNEPATRRQDGRTKILNDGRQLLLWLINENE